MPNRPIDFKFTSDVVALLNGLGKAELSVEDLEQAFVTASNSSTDLEKKINKATREAEQDVDKLTRAVGEVPKETEKAADKAAKDFDRIGDEAEHSFDGAAESARDIGRDTGDSFMGSLGESMASGQGDLSESLSETLGEAVGQAPLPVAAIGALVLLVWNHFKAESEKRKQEFADSFDLVDMMTAEIDKVAAMEEALTDLGVGNLQDGLENAQALAEALGISMGDATAVISGQTGPAVDDVRAALEGVVAEAEKAGEEGRVLTTAELEAVNAASKLLELGEQNVEATGRAVDGAHLYQQAYDGVNREVLDLNKHLTDVDANMDGVVDTTDQMALKAADVNMDGYLSQLEIANADLGEAVTASGKLDPGMPNTLSDAQAIRDAILKIPTEVRVKILDESAVVNKTGSGYTSTAYLPRARAGEVN